MPDHFGDVPELLAKLTPYVMSGKIKYRGWRLDRESIDDSLCLR
jgi:hypothetical protein